MPDPPARSPAVLCLPPHRSVLALGPGTRLVGLDPATAFTVEDLPPALAAMLDELTEPVAGPTLLARAVQRGADPGEAAALLAWLTEAGALIDAGGPQRRARHRACSTVLVTGGGPLAVGVVTGLVLGGVGAVHVETSGTVGSDELGTGFLDTDRGQQRLAAVAGAVRRLRPRAGTGSLPRRLVPDLVVLTDALTPDPVRVAELHAAGTAHLPARLRDGVGVVGPLVLPGRTACLRCLDLHRCARDERWAAASAQLSGRTGRADPATAVATAALATAQALAALDAAAGTGPRPPSLETTLEIDPGAGSVVRRTWAAVPDCGCGAADRAGPAGAGERTGRGG